MSKFPLSPYKIVGDLLFVSGQIGQQEGQLVSEDFSKQLTQAVKNIESILQGNNLRLIDVIDVTAFLVNDMDYPVFNEVYAQLFSEPYPTRTTVTVKSLPLGAKVELKIIANNKKSLN